MNIVCAVIIVLHITFVLVLSNPIEEETDPETPTTTIDPITTATTTTHITTQAVCKCASSWTSPEDGDRCAEEQNGCANCDGNKTGSWCNVENPGCSTDEGDGWSYCDDEQMSNECRCASSWTSPEDGDRCAEEQNGCAKCDGDEARSWCIVENPGCSTDEGDGWSYCANPTTVAPAAKNGHEYCENQDMIRNEAECTSSSCCHWNTWEEGDASFDGDGRCWSDIGTNICLDMNQ